MMNQSFQTTSIAQELILNVAKMDSELGKLVNSSISTAIKVSQSLDQR